MGTWEQRGAKRTLGLLEDTLLNATLQSLVEDRVEHGVGDLNLVVAPDVLLQRLARRAIAILEL